MIGRAGHDVVYNAMMKEKYASSKAGKAKRPGKKLKKAGKEMTKKMKPIKRKLR